MILPPKPQFHPSDSVRSIQSRVDAFYNDLERIFKHTVRIYTDDPDGNHWVCERPQMLIKQAWLVNPEAYEPTDEELLAELALRDPLLAERLKKRLK